jgi:hypothetical protein
VKGICLLKTGPQLIIDLIYCCERGNYVLRVPHLTLWSGFISSW